MTFRYHLRVSSAGELLRAARTAARLSQRELALRAQVTQSVVSAYESGARDPSLTTLQRLVEAAGQQLDVHVRASDSPLGLQGPLGRRLRRRRDAVRRVAAAHQVDVRGVFGSVARSDEHAGSDVDLLVHLPQGAGLFTVFRVEAALEELLGAAVDVVPDEGLTDEVRVAVERDLVPL